MKNLGSLFTSLVMFLQPEIGCRNLTLVYINQSVVLLPVVLLKVTVSKKLSMIIEDLLDFFFFETEFRSC